MPPCQLHVYRKKNFLRRGGAIFIDALQALPNSLEDYSIAVAAFADSFFSICPPTIRQCTSSSDTPLLDIRGRSIDSFRNAGESAPQGLSANEEELLFVKGLLFEPPPIDAAERSSADTASEFVFRIHSKFAQFRNGSRIEFLSLPSSSAVLRPIGTEFSAHLAARLVPAQLLEIRLGIERYRPRSFGRQWGSVPNIFSKFHLVIRQTGLRLRAEESYESKQPTLPPLEQSLLPAFHHALQKADLTQDFLPKLEAAIAAL